jgi:hypothetical protein
MTALRATAMGVLADLRERRLLPVAVLLLVLVIALPVVLLKPEKAAAPVPTPAGTAAATPNGLPSPEQALNSARPLVTLTVLDKPSDLRSFKSKDPFKPLKPIASGNNNSSLSGGATPAVPGGAQTASAGAGGGGSSGGGSTGGLPTGGGGTGGGGGGTTIPGGGVIKKRTVTQYTYELDASIKTPAGKKRYRHLKRLSMLPSSGNPLLIFLGVTSDAQSALFLINGALHPVSGDGAHCRPSHAKCAAVWFQAGESYTFVDAKDGKYVLHVRKINRVVVKKDSKKVSSGSAGASASTSTVAGPGASGFFMPALVDLVTQGGPDGY